MKNLHFNKIYVPERRGSALVFGRAGLLAGVALLSAAASPVQAAEAADAAASSGDIVVTAQRREENILKVPISVTSYSPEQMDVQGIRQIEDLSRLTPSLVFARRPGVSGQVGANISIRGIVSDVGSATTAVYLDDTPIQVRNIGYWGGNPYPRVFDLDRVEVLRGPQGTLFGAGAEGGAVRFLTPQPNFEKGSIYGRSEVSTTENGAPSYEGGIAIGGPISDTLAVRASAWYRRDGGYIDRYNPTVTTLIKRDINSQNTYASRMAVSWRPVPELTITPSIFYQSIKSNGRNQFWEAQSNIGSEDYKTGIYTPEPSKDVFYLPALKAQYDFGNISLISNTSYLDRKLDQILDYATFLSANRTGNPFGTYGNKDTTNAYATEALKQTNFTQEIRLQSANPGGLIDWSVGAYYSKAEQHFTNYSRSGRIPGVISSGFPQLLGVFNLFDQVDSSDKQLAGFGSLDVKPLDNLKITLGLRVTKSTFGFVEVRDGPVNSGARTTTGSGQKATAVTPKFGVSYQLDTNNMVYASASKGFRPGGAQSPVDPTFCAADLATLGLKGSPTSYKSDSLWSYEAGAKNKLLGGMLVLDVNVYLVKWKNIQQAIRLPRCSFDFIGNLGNATGKGTDISISVRPFLGLSLGANIGYNHTTYDQNVLGGNGVVIRQKGDHIGAASLTGSVFTQFDHELSSNMTGYMRADYSFQNKGIRANPNVSSYDPGLPGLPATSNLSMRAGIKMGGIDLSAFVNNLTNSNDPLSRGHDTIGSPLYYVETYRPRTFGVTAQFRY